MFPEKLNEGRYLNLQIKYNILGGTTKCAQYGEESPQL